MLRLKFSFNPISLMLMMAIILIACLSVSAETENIQTSQSFGNWFSKNWSFVAIVISETLALLPTKVNGVIHGLWSIFGSIIKKK